MSERNETDDARMGWAASGFSRRVAQFSMALRNRISDQEEKELPISQALEVPEHDYIADVLDSEAEGEVVTRILQSPILSELERQTLSLIYIQGKKLSEVAFDRGISRQGVEEIIMNARQKLDETGFTSHFGNDL